VKERATELAARGMPMQMAMAVAYGKLPLNEALEKLARREQVNRLMERHSLSRALATQIVLGQASLDQVLSRRRLSEHRESHRARSVLEEHAATGAPVTLLLHGHRRLMGRILVVDAYMFRVKPEEGEPEDIHKLQVKAAFDPEAYKRVRKILKFDKELEKAPIAPIARPQDRYTCSDRRLFRYMDEKTEVQVTLLEGEVIRGVIGWFSRYEFGLKLKSGDAEVVVFRHALHDLREV
jgi:sRNA-binding regulator protein Hfq